jgi:hypothetical protein
MCLHRNSFAKWEVENIYDRRLERVCDEKSMRGKFNSRGAGYLSRWGGWRITALPSRCPLFRIGQGVPSVKGINYRSSAFN